MMNAKDANAMARAAREADNEKRREEDIQRKREDEASLAQCLKQCEIEIERACERGKNEKTIELPIHWVKAGGSYRSHWTKLIDTLRGSGYKVAVQGENGDGYGKTVAVLHVSW